MTDKRKFLAVLTAGLASLALAACGGDGGGAANGGGSMAENQRADDIILGDPDAPVLVIEYASVVCPACQAFHTQVFPDFKEKYIDTGLVKYAFREIPTSPVPLANAGFLLARCAPEDRYYDVLDILFERQQRIVTSSNPRAELEAVAAAVGIDAEGFEACINDEAALARITEVAEEGARRYGATSTPTFIIDGETYPGAKPLSFFDDTLAPLLGDQAPAAEAEQD